jgi:hypothetical protein
MSNTGGDQGEGLEQRIRRCIREELDSASLYRRPNSNQTLVAQTRDLIQSSASFASRQLGEVTGTGSRPIDPSVVQQDISTVPARSITGRSHPSHPLRFPKRKTNTFSKKPSKKTKQAVCVLVR